MTETPIRCLAMLAASVFFAMNVYADALPLSTTIFPMTLLVQDIGKESVSVFTIAKPGSDPHVSALLPSSVISVSKSKGILTFHGIEMNESLSHIGPPLTIIGNGSHDWLNISKMVKGGDQASLIDQIREYLCALSRERCTEFQAHAEMTKIAVNKVLSECAAHSVDTLIIVTHPSWGPFLGELGYKDVAPLFDTRGETVLPQALVDAKKRASSAKKVLFIADPDTEIGLQRMMKEDLRSDVLVLDESGAGSTSLAGFYSALCGAISRKIESDGGS